MGPPDPSFKGDMLRAACGEQRLYDYEAVIRLAPTSSVGFWDPFFNGRKSIGNWGLSHPTYKGPITPLNIRIKQM